MEQNMSTALGERLRQLRRKARITQAQMSAALSVTEQAVSKWERGLSFPDITILPKIAELLSTSTDYILTGKENVRYVPLSKYDLCRTDKQVAPKKQTPPPVSYNGIEPSGEFPPRGMAACGDYAPLPVPYLAAPPKVIDISVGRQLFVDDFLIEKTDMIRHYHRAEKYAGNPIFFPETPMEKGEGGHVAMAAPFSDGVWYDPKDGKTKLWYHAGWFDGTAYAESDDGLHFERVDCGLGDDNRCIPKRKGIQRDGAAVVLDRYNGGKRPYKMFLFVRDTHGECGEIWDSADGKAWKQVTVTGATGDRSTVFYNPFRRKWVYSMRSGFGALGIRARSYVEADSLEEGAPLADPVPWTRCDRLDPVLPSVGDRASLYNLDAVAYESVLLGAFSVFLGPENNISTTTGIPKYTELHLGYSRDGFHWYRPEVRVPLIAPERENRDSWERGYIHSSNGILMIRDDTLWFYYTAFRGDESITRKPTAEDGMYANASMGLATMRRDGFASMDAYGFRGTLQTRPLRFDGSYLFVNGDFHAGKLRAEIRDEDGIAIDGYSFDDCITFSDNSTKAQLRFSGGKTLEALSGTVVRICFECTEGSLYAFWVSDSENGRSRGALGAGEVGKSSYWDI